MNFIPCVAWVPRGKAKSCPDKLQLTADEMRNLIKETKEMINNNTDAQGQSEEEEEESDGGERDGHQKKDGEVNKDDTEEKSSKNCASDEDDEEDFDKKYNLDDYDNEEEDERPFMNINDVTVFVDNNEDEYITGYDAIEEEDQVEEEDFLIKKSDNLLVVGHVEDQSSVLEIYVYNKMEDSFYVHHDIVLPSYPLALEWLDFHPSEENPGNYIALADMSPVIKIWDLDVVDILEPEYCLGEEVSGKKSKKAPKKKSLYHSDAVLSLSWNKQVRHILASGSADNTVIIWNLQDGSVLNKLESHTNKVQALEWHPVESSFLLSGCTDGLITLFDCRSPDSECLSWEVEGEIERVTWNLADPFKFFCSTDKGSVYNIDTRSKDVENGVQAHSDAVTGLDMSSHHPNILITASMDQTVKFWDVVEKKMIKSTKLKVGAIYTAKFSPDSKWTVAVGGSKESNSLKVMDFTELFQDAQKDENSAKEDLVDTVKIEQSASTSKKDNIKSEVSFKGKKNHKNFTADYSNQQQSYSKQKTFSKNRYFNSEPGTSHGNFQRSNNTQYRKNNFNQNIHKQNIKPATKVKRDFVNSKNNTDNVNNLDLNASQHESAKRVKKYD